MEASKRSKKLTRESFNQLQEGLSIMFSHWREIQDAVNQGFAGPYTYQKAFNLEAKVLAFFTQPNRKVSELLYIDDLEELLCEGMKSLALIPCIDIVEEVAEKLMIMYEECLEGNYQTIQKLRGARPIPYVKQPVVDDNDDQDDDEDDGAPSMMMDLLDINSNNEVTSQAMEVDEWVTISRRKKTGKTRTLKN